MGCPDASIIVNYYHGEASLTWPKKRIAVLSHIFILGAPLQVWQWFASWKFDHPIKRNLINVRHRFRKFDLPVHDPRPSQSGCLITKMLQVSSNDTCLTFETFCPSFFVCYWLDRWSSWFRYTTLIIWIFLGDQDTEGRCCSSKSCPWCITVRSLSCIACPQTSSTRHRTHYCWLWKSSQWTQFDYPFLHLVSEELE